MAAKVGKSGTSGIGVEAFERVRSIVDGRYQSDDKGAYGAGMSSFGPAVYAVAEELGE
ncbi:MAG: hypothetical protein K0A89_08475 [ANME-2 cluster archaeon]|nr:hypothetical protein [ANME-2 cluster archaeon]